MDSLVKFPGLQLECHNLIRMLVTRKGVIDDLSEHLTFVEQFKYEGAQGKTGILKHKKNGELLVYKTSIGVDYSTRHESTIMNRIKGVRKWCPNFCEGIGMIKTLVSYSSSRRLDPFTKEDGAKVYMDVMLSEYIPGSKGLSERVSFLNTRRLFSVIRQILTAIEIGYREFGLVHYDLHTDNILLVNCPEDAIFLYNLGDRQICIPTHGVVPVIIDYGFAYVKGSSEPLYMNMGFTDSGYLACVADPYYDARIFLVNMADLMKCKDPDKYTEFYNEVHNLYKGLSYHRTKGWDNYGQYSAAEMVEYTISEIELDDPICEEISEYVSVYTLMFQSLVSLPLRNKENGDFRPYYKQVALEFSKFESGARTSFSKKFIMFNVIDMARKYKSLYFTGGKKEEALRSFRRELGEQIEMSMKFYSPPEEVDYDNLLNNLYLMADCIETIYYRVMSKSIVEHKERYAKAINLKKNLAIHDQFEAKYTTEYRLTPQTPVYVWDTISKSNTIVNKFTTAECCEFNRLSVTQRATWLWEKITSRDSVMI